MSRAYGLSNKAIEVKARHSSPVASLVFVIVINF